MAFLDIADDAAERLIGILQQEGLPPPLYLPCDLRDIPALQAAIAEVGRRLGPISVLVNNAANDQRHSYEDVTVEYWDERMATNLRHQFFAIQAVAPMMREAGRRVDHQFRLDLLAHQTGRHAGLHHRQGGGRRTDQGHGARPRARTASGSIA